MSNFSFYATWDDTWRLLAAILAEGKYSLTPDVRYPTATPLLASILDDSVKQLCRETGNAYLWSPDFSTRPPYLGRVSAGENVGKYFVDMSKDGPGLEFHLPPCYEKDGVVQLAPGSLWHQKRTKNTSTNLWEPASDQLKAGFREVKGIIQNQLTEIEIDSNRYFIGVEAKRLVDDRQAILHAVEV
jgi:hypothetical protein